MFAPGDEVMCVREQLDDPESPGEFEIFIGHVYTVDVVYDDGMMELLENPERYEGWAWCQEDFRKVERKRDWQAWLAANKTDFEGPKRQKVVA